MNGWYFLLISFLITSCRVNTISQTKLNDTYSMKSLLVAPWGENQAEIIPTYISSGLAFETSPTSKLAPILFELDNDHRIYTIDASSKFLTIFDKKNFVERLELHPVVTNNTIKSFKVLNAKEYIFLVLGEQSTYHLIHWNSKIKKTHTIALGSYRDAQLIFSSDKKSLYCWTEKEDYTGILWQFPATDLTKVPTKFDELPFVSSQVFEKEGKIIGVKFFSELNRRGLISIDLKTETVQEKVCSKELYGPLLYPFGVNQAGNLFTYGLPNEEQVYGTIYNVNQEGVLQENKTFHSLMSTTFPDYSNTLLTSTQNWKVLADGTIVLAVMTTKELHIIALESQ